MILFRGVEIVHTLYVVCMNVIPLVMISSKLYKDTFQLALIFFLFQEMSDSDVMGNDDDDGGEEEVMEVGDGEGEEEGDKENQSEPAAKRRKSTLSRR